MKRFAAGVATIALLLAVAALAQPMHQQQAQQNQQKQQQDQQHMQMQHMQQEQTRTMRMQATMQEMDGVMAHMRELSHWMQQNGTSYSLREMGQAMFQAGDRMQFMLKKMDQLCQDPEMQKDQERMRDMDQLQEKMRAMTREMKEAHDTFKQMVGAPS